MSRHLLAWGSAAAAAIVLIVMTVTRLNAASAWHVTQASGEGIAVVDGRPVPMNHIPDLEASLTPGARIRVPPGCALELSSARMLAIRMLPETDATVPRAPGRWFGRDVRAGIQGGEWRVTTGRDFAGARLVMTTPSARVELREGAAAVICEAQGTCVCVYRGMVFAAREHEKQARVDPGFCRNVWVDETRTAESDAIRPEEAAELARFVAEKRGNME